MTDKTKELTASIQLVNEKLNFIGTVDKNTPISIDYIPPLGDNLGYTSLELLLLSLSSCMGSAMLSLLRKMKKTILKCDINTKGMRKEEHPTGFKNIFMEIKIKSPDLTDAELVKVLKLTEETYCPVWSMLNGNVELEIKHVISQ